jgi:hypothetical protein
MATHEPQPARVNRKLKTKQKIKEAALPLDDYLHAATAVLPGGILREIRMPSRGSSTVAVCLWAPGGIRPKGGNIVLLNRATAGVLSIDRASDAPLSRKLVELANVIHKTELGDWR